MHIAHRFRPATAQCTTHCLWSVMNTLAPCLVTLRGQASLAGPAMCGCQAEPMHWNPVLLGEHDRGECQCAATVLAYSVLSAESG